MGKQKAADCWSCRNQRGDTIIAVMICVIILGAIIILAYAVINRSVHENIRARERNQVVKVVQAQVEGLKSIVANNESLENLKNDSTQTLNTQGAAANQLKIWEPRPDNRPDQSLRWFCLNASNSYVALNAIDADADIPNPDRDDSCGDLVNLQGLTASNLRIGIRYTADPDCLLGAVDHPNCPDSGDENLFIILAIWDRRGGKQDRIETPIRLHKPNPNAGS